MPWTDRIETKTSYKDIIDYLDTHNALHDYRLGSVEYDGIRSFVTFEDVISGYVWSFAFDEVISFQMDLDMAGDSFINEIIEGKLKNEIDFMLTSGRIYIAAEKVTLGIPDMIVQ